MKNIFKNRTKSSIILKLSLVFSIFISSTTPCIAQESFWQKTKKMILNSKIVKTVLDKKNTKIVAPVIAAAAVLPLALVLLFKKSRVKVPKKNIFQKSLGLFAALGKGASKGASAGGKFFAGSSMAKSSIGSFFGVLLAVGAIGFFGWMFLKKKAKDYREGLEEGCNGNKENEDFGFIGNIKKIFGMQIEKKVKKFKENLKQEDNKDKEDSELVKDIKEIKEELLIKPIKKKVKEYREKLELGEEDGEREEEDSEFVKDIKKIVDIKKDELFVKPTHDFLTGMKKDLKSGFKDLLSEVSKNPVKKEGTAEEEGREEVIEIDEKSRKKINLKDDFLETVDLFGKVSAVKLDKKLCEIENKNLKDIRDAYDSVAQLNDDETEKSEQEFKAIVEKSEVERNNKRKEFLEANKDSLESVQNSIGNALETVNNASGKKVNNLISNVVYKPVLTNVFKACKKINNGVIKPVESFTDKAMNKIMKPVAQTTHKVVDGVSKAVKGFGQEVKDLYNVAKDEIKINKQMSEDGEKQYKEDKDIFGYNASKQKINLHKQMRERQKIEQKLRQEKEQERQVEREKREYKELCDYENEEFRKRNPYNPVEKGIFALGRGISSAAGGLFGFGKKAFGMFSRKKEVEKPIIVIEENNLEKDNLDALRKKLTYNNRPKRPIVRRKKSKVFEDLRKLEKEEKFDYSESEYLDNEHLGRRVNTLN